MWYQNQIITNSLYRQSSNLLSKRFKDQSKKPMNPTYISKTKNLKSSIKPVQLIKFDANKNVFITDQAIQIFNKMTTQQLHIVTVAGKYRTGKSYILNRVLLDQNQGFEVGPTINACTKGLWMWPELIKINSNGQQKDCLIVDTQGLGSLQEGQNTDVKIFLMATLLSSYMIYNSVGNIDQKALQSLGLVVNLANIMQKQNSLYDCQQLINSFPSFMWLVRDFSLKLQNQIGQPITSQQYLQNALKLQKGTSKMAQKKNQVRKQLKTFFRQRDCFTLVRPTLSEVDLQNLSTVSQKKLRPQFVRLASELKSRIHNNIRPKKIRGKAISPQGFIELCNYYINTINSGKLPSISSHWDNLCLSESSRLINKYRLLHKQRLLFQANSLNQGGILQTHKQILSQGKQYIQRSFLGKLQKQLSKQKLDKLLTQNLHQILTNIRDKNYQNIQQKVNKVFKPLKQCNQIQFKHLIQAVQTIYDEFQLLQELNRQNNKIYQCFYLHSKQTIPKLLYQLQSQYEKQTNSLKSKLNLAEIQSKNNQNQLIQVTQKYQQIIQQKQKQLIKLQIESTHLNGIKKQFQDKVQQNSELSFKIRSLKDQLEQSMQCNYDQLNQQIVQLTEQHKQQINLLQDQKYKIQVQFASISSSLKQVSINLRKTTREYDIIKSKLSQYQQNNTRIQGENQKLKQNIANLEAQARKNRTSSTVKFSRHNTSGIQQSQTHLKQMGYKVDQLQFNSRRYQLQVSNLQKLLSDQKQINNLLMQTPQNMNYLSLKKNYQFQKSQNIKSQQSLKKYQNALYHMSRFQCILCKQLINKQKIHDHYLKCVSSWNMEFDISYQIDGDRQIWFIIQVTAQQSLTQNNHNVESELNKWEIRKNINNIRLLLTKVNKRQNLTLFQQQSSLIINSNLDDDLLVNLNEQRRVSIDQTCNCLKQKIWHDHFLIQFFGVDIHVLNKPKLKQNKQETFFDTSPTSIQLKQTKKKKNYKLSLGLDEIEEQNQWGKINLASSVKLMKTTKFTKKAFNFGPNVL